MIRGSIGSGAYSSQCNYGIETVSLRCFILVSLVSTMFRFPADDFSSFDSHLHSDCLCFSCEQFGERKKVSGLYEE